MKHFKLKNIIAVLLVCIMVFALAGCNYMNRPDGAKNNSTDNNNRLAKLLEKDREVTVPSDDDDNDYDDDYNDPEPEPEPEPEPDLSETPFDAPGDVITKINEILGSMSNDVVDATSSTGVKDELMTCRTNCLTDRKMPWKLLPVTST